MKSALLVSSLATTASIAYWTFKGVRRRIVAPPPEPAASILNALKLVEDPESGIAYQVWASAHFLAEYVASLENPSNTILELGAGCGMVGMTAATFSKRVVLTDKADTIAHTELNMRTNIEAGTVPSGVASCRVLEWGGDGGFAQGEFDLILLSDCTYWEHLYDRLLNTLILLIGPETRAIIAHQWRRREVEEKFFARLSARFAVGQFMEKGDIMLYSVGYCAGADHTPIPPLDMTDTAAVLGYFSALEADLESIQAMEEMDEKENAAT